jgi:hypothetical protein
VKNNFGGGPQGGQKKIQNARIKFKIQTTSKDISDQIKKNIYCSKQNATYYDIMKKVGIIFNLIIFYHYLKKSNFFSKFNFGSS